MSAASRLKRAALVMHETAKTEDGIRRAVSPKLTGALNSALHRWANGDRPPPKSGTTSDQHSFALIDQLLEAQNAVVFQDFAVAPKLRKLVHRDIPSTASSELLYLYASAHLLLGNLARDMGNLNGIHDARWHYERAERYGRDAGWPRLVARVMLLRDGVLKEMSAGPKGGKTTNVNLQQSLRNYFSNATNPLLSPENRGWANVWAGSVFTKMGCAEEARKRINTGIQMLKDNGNAGNSAFFKLAGAELAQGHFDEASAAIRRAALPAGGSILQLVRRDKRLAHILLGNSETFDEGASLLEQTMRRADDAWLGHQVQSIYVIARDFKLSLY